MTKKNPWVPKPPKNHARIAREKLTADVEKFLANGGVIEQVPIRVGPPVTNFNNRRGGK